MNQIKNGRIKGMGFVFMALSSNNTTLEAIDWLLDDQRNLVEIIYKQTILGKSLGGPVREPIGLNYYRASKSDVAYLNKINKLFLK